MNFTNDFILSKISKGYKLTKMFYRLKFLEKNRWVVSGESLNYSALEELKNNISESKMFRVTTWKK
jgi:hypothetical protein